MLKNRSEVHKKTTIKISLLSLPSVSKNKVICVVCLPGRLQKTNTQSKRHKEKYKKINKS